MGKLLHYPIHFYWNTLEAKTRTRTRIRNLFCLTKKKETCFTAFPHPLFSSNRSLLSPPLSFFSALLLLPPLSFFFSFFVPLTFLFYLKSLLNSLFFNPSRVSIDLGLSRWICEREIEWLYPICDCEYVYDFSWVWVFPLSTLFCSYNWICTFLVLLCDFVLIMLQKF